MWGSTRTLKHAWHAHVQAGDVGASAKALQATIDDYSYYHQVGACCILCWAAGEQQQQMLPRSHPTCLARARGALAALLKWCTRTYTRVCALVRT